MYRISEFISKRQKKANKKTLTNLSDEDERDDLKQYLTMGKHIFHKNKQLQRITEIDLYEKKIPVESIYTL